jgi:hypothetical protein
MMKFFTGISWKDRGIFFQYLGLLHILDILRIKQLIAYSVQHILSMQDDILLILIIEMHCENMHIRSMLISRTV